MSRNLGHLMRKTNVCKSMGVTITKFDGFRIPPAFTDENDIDYWDVKCILDHFATVHNTPAGRKAAAEMRLAELKADQLDIKLQRERGELAPLDLIRIILSKFAKEANVMLDSLPARLKERQPSLNSACMDKIKSTISELKNKLATIDTSDELDAFIETFADTDDT